MLLPVLMIAGCSGREEKKTEQAERVVADIEAAQMEGRNAARPFLTTEATDTMRLHGMLLEVAAKRSEYLRQKKDAECAAFDSIFISTIRSVRPGLAQQIETARKNLR